jgi:hypothetical protein
MLPSPSWLPTKAAAHGSRVPATRTQKPESTAVTTTAEKSTAQEGPRAAISTHPLCSDTPPKPQPPDIFWHRRIPPMAGLEAPEKARRWSPTEEIGWVRSEEILHISRFGRHKYALREPVCADFNRRRVCVG